MTHYTWLKTLLIGVACGFAVFAEAAKLVPDEFVVKPGLIRYWKFTVGSSAQVIGGFRAQGGSRNDIEAIVAEWDECENWLNGNGARVLYSSGKVTNGKLNVSLRSGEYCVAFSNRMSAVSAKEIAAAIELRD